MSRIFIDEGSVPIVFGVNLMAAKLGSSEAYAGSEKTKFRKLVEDRFKNLTSDELFEKSAAIQTLLGRFLHKHVGLWGAYKPLMDEPQLNWPQIQTNQISFSFPRVEKTKTLVFADSGLFQKGSLGIEEPVGPALSKEKFCGFVVPGRAFSTRGSRLGRGQGYYDQFLNGLNVIKVGVAFEEQIFSMLPIEDHDVRMDFVITEHRVIEVGEC